MVFSLEDIAKIEAERGVFSDLTETHIYNQETANMLDDPDIIKKIHGIIEPYLTRAENYVWSRETGDMYTVFRDAFLNAGMWGNRDIPGKKITVTMKYGLFGSVIYVEDEGEGFDFLAQIERLSEKGKHEYHHRGGGMRKFYETPLQIGYHRNGNIISLSSRVYSLDEVQTFLDSKLSKASS